LDLLGDLAQVGRYLSRGEPDCNGDPLDARIRRRVTDAIQGDGPAVVVAHSLGSVVALEALLETPHEVSAFVTLGSPIAMRTVVLPRLRPAPPSTPRLVDCWLNFWDRDDLVAARPLLEGDIKANDAGVAPKSCRVDSNGLWVHTATKYLAQAAVAGRIIEALGAAGPDTRKTREN
jgi:pimeloyl-ACP methyl ester carboxylesterase